MRRLVLLVPLVVSCGCCLGHQIERQMLEEIGEGVDAGIRLTIAVEAYRLGSGR